MVLSVAWALAAAMAAAAVAAAAAWGPHGLAGLRSMLPLLSPFSFSWSGVLGSPVLSFSTKPEKMWLGEMGKGLPMAERS